MENNKKYTIYDVLQYIEEYDSERKNEDQFLDNQLFSSILLGRNGISYRFEVARAREDYEEETNRLTDLRARAVNMLSATKEEQETFIIEMTPTLDIFFDKKEKEKRLRKEVHN